MKNICGLLSKTTSLDSSHFLLLFSALGHCPADLYVISLKIKHFWLLNFLGGPKLSSVYAV